MTAFAATGPAFVLPFGSRHRLPGLSGNTNAPPRSGGEKAAKAGRVRPFPHIFHIFPLFPFFPSLPRQTSDAVALTGTSYRYRNLLIPRHQWQASWTMPTARPPRLTASTAHARRRAPAPASTPTFSSSGAGLPAPRSRAFLLPTVTLGVVGAGSGLDAGADDGLRLALSYRPQGYRHRLDARHGRHAARAHHQHGDNGYDGLLLLPCAHFQGCLSPGLTPFKSVCATWASRETWTKSRPRPAAWSTPGGATAWPATSLRASTRGATTRGAR